MSRRIRWLRCDRFPRRALGQSRLLRGERVWVKVGAGGEPASPARDGRVDILYKPGGKVYRAGARNLAADPDPEDAERRRGGAVAARRRRRPRRPARQARAAAARPLPKDAIIVYTDGACTGNPGPMGIGVVILDGGKRRELSRVPGRRHQQHRRADRDRARARGGARAIARWSSTPTRPTRSASSARAGRPRPTRSWSRACASWRAEFNDLRLVKVAGHAGVPENERATSWPATPSSSAAERAMRRARAGPRRRDDPVGLDLHRHQGHRARRAADALPGVPLRRRRGGDARALRQADPRARRAHRRRRRSSACSTRSGSCCRCSGRSTPRRRSRRSSRRSTRRWCRWSAFALYRTRPTHAAARRRWCSRPSG